MNKKIENITWTVSGKIDKITRTNGSTKPDLEFAYDAQGNRIRKIVKPSGSLSTPTLWTTTDYVRDPQGNVLAVYNGQFVSSAHDYKLKERYLYGSSLVGMDLHEEDMYVTTAGIPLQNGDPALKQFQLSNHLGNVLAVVNGERKAIPDVTGNSIDHFEAQLENSSDYYPFGSLLRERSTRWVWKKGPNFSTNPADVFLALVNMNEDPTTIAIDGKSYRFSFNGKEKDDEVKGLGNSLDFGERILDTRLGRWLSIDPLYRKYPSLSPFNFAVNSPIFVIDPNGGDVIVLSAPKSVGGLGHAAVLIGNDKDGWTLYSKNGTTGSIPGAKSSGNPNKHPQNGIPVGSLDNFALNYNMSENGEVEYTSAFRITSDTDTDSKMSIAASKQTGSWYDVTGKISGSCIDVASDALEAGGFDGGNQTNYVGKAGELYTTQSPIPNERFEQIKKNNKGTDATTEILPTKEQTEKTQKDFQMKSELYKEMLNTSGNNEGDLTPKDNTTVIPNLPK